LDWGKWSFLSWEQNIGEKNWFVLHEMSEGKKILGLGQKDRRGLNHVKRKVCVNYRVGPEEKERIVN